MDLIILWMQKGFSYIGPFFLLLGLLIFVHELGHFLVAKFFGVRVEVFSLGFGKKIFQFKRGDTVYCVSLVPLGGYVKMFGDDPTAEVPESEKKHAFLHKPVWPRIAIVLAGPLMNFFFAGILFAMIGLIGQPVAGPSMGDIKPNTVAHEAGFRSGDKILSIQGEKISRWQQVKTWIEDSSGTPLEFVLDRKDEAVVIQATPILSPNEFIFSTKTEVGKIAGLKIDSLGPLVGLSDPNTPAGQAGFNHLELIKSINGQEIKYWRELEPLLASLGEVSQLDVEVQKYEYSKDETEHPTRKLTVTGLTQTPTLESLGLSPSELFLYRVIPDSPAQKMGLKEGDKIVSVNGNKMSKWQDVLESVKDNGEKPIHFQVLRAGEIKEFHIQPKMTEVNLPQGQVEKRYTVGIVSGLSSVANPSVEFKLTSPIDATVYGVEQSWIWTKLVAMSFVRLVQGEVSSQNVGGVITIGVVAGKSFAVGIAAFLKMMAIISVNLFLLNLLPIPVLDGGHLVFFLIEAIRGAPLSLKKMELAQQVGLVLLISLMVFALFNDITNLMK